MEYIKVLRKQFYTLPVNFEANVVWSRLKRTCVRERESERENDGTVLGNKLTAISSCPPNLAIPTLQFGLTTYIMRINNAFILLQKSLTRGVRIWYTKCERYSHNSRFIQFAVYLHRVPSNVNLP